MVANDSFPKINDAIVQRLPTWPLPEKVLQFGEGNFLRGFADWMIDTVNRRRVFDGSIVIVQPVAQGLIDVLERQQGLYTLLMRGIEGGKLIESRHLVGSVSRALNPYENWSSVVSLARSKDLRFVVSNTTEAGIAYSDEPYDPQLCPTTFPAKVTSLLYERFLAVGGHERQGLIFLPCELIEHNGHKLKEYVLKYATAWNLGPDFLAWLDSANYFLNTLVDRIVPGYPKDEADKLKLDLGYDDSLIVTGEVFHLWVIEGPKHLADEIPFHKVGLNVVWTDDMAPYRTRKVRVLNGAHTSSVLGAFLCGLNTVGEMMNDTVFGQFVRRAVFNEIVPMLKMDANDRQQYAEAVMERFQNPFIKHELLSISLNSVSKWKVRVLPSLLDYTTDRSKLPPALTFSLAALIRFYDGTPVSERELRGQRNGEPYPIRDESNVLEFFALQWKAYHESHRLSDLVDAVLANREFWGLDLTSLEGFAEAVSGHLQRLIDGEVAPRL